VDIEWEKEEEEEEEEATVREEESAAATARVMKLEPELILDSEPRSCPLRAKHMLKEKRWMKCILCRSVLQQVALQHVHADTRADKTRLRTWRIEQDDGYLNWDI
jgi:hypothetical protein